MNQCPTCEDLGMATCHCPAPTDVFNPKTLTHYTRLYAPLRTTEEVGAEAAIGDPLATQVGGSHYKDLKIQPVEYIHANGLGYFEGNVVKYVTRWKAKGGTADLEKAKHYLELLISLTPK